MNRLDPLRGASILRPQVQLAGTVGEMLRADTDAILAKLGYSPERIAELKAQEVV